MADNKDKERKDLPTIRNKSALLTYGLDNTLDDEADMLSGLVKNVIINTKQKFGGRVNNQPLNYFNEINLGSIYSELMSDGKSNKDKNKDKSASLKEYMNNAKVDVNGLLMEDGSRLLNFNNYKIIQRHIPECAQALRVYKDNIMSPDDFTKLIFNVDYDNPTASTKAKMVVRKNINELTERYKIEELANDIIERALMLSEDYLAVLPLNEELNSLLDDLSSGKTLNEDTIRVSDVDVINNTILSENVVVNDEEVVALNEALNLEDKLLTKNECSNLVARFINENVTLGSVKELLIERAEVETDLKSTGGLGYEIPGTFKKNKDSKKKTKNSKDKVYVNGSVLRHLDPEKMVELKVDNICYGYYYAEDATNNVPFTSYFGNGTGRNASQNQSLASNNTITTTTGGAYSPSNNGAAAQLGVGEQKLRLVADLFINQLTKKIDKEFLKKNKQFKEFIYDLLRQDYIIKKGLKLTYFKPEEVIKFECDSIYRDIVFFAKLYISILSDNLLIKLGRAHDKRLFYVNTGLDAQYEQAIQSVIQDIKTKDYKMENLNDFNTLLMLAPGRFDDYFMPSINGDRPVEIETLPGMDTEMDSEFLQYLRKCMMSGMGVPANLLDVSSEVDFARNISAMNANFVRSVIVYQKKFTNPFTRLYQNLYENEFKYSNEGEEIGNDTFSIDSKDIKISFPSPATLAMTNFSEQIQAADTNADFIASQYFPPLQDGSNEEKRMEFKVEVVKDLLPGIDWEKYDDLKKKFDKDFERKKTEKKDKNPTEMDPYGQQY